MTAHRGVCYRPGMIANGKFTGRTCPACKVFKRPDEFRDPDRQGVTGRTPKYCWLCRLLDPEKYDKAYRAAIAGGSRDDCRERQQRYAQRSDAEVAAAEAAAFPFGEKWCPGKETETRGKGVGNGCDRWRPLSEFAESRWQQNNRAIYCRECSGG